MKSRIRNIPGFDGKYQITTEGVIWSYMHGNWRKLKTSLVGGGYLQIGLRVDGRQRRYLVHRLVLETFVGPCPVGMEARHFPDRTKTNCRLDNLKWGTRAENTKDKLTQGSILYGERNPRAKLTWEKVRAIRKKSASGKFSRANLAREYKVSWNMIDDILLGNNWKE